MEKARFQKHTLEELAMITTSEKITQDLALASARQKWANHPMTKKHREAKERQQAEDRNRHTFLFNPVSTEVEPLDWNPPATVWPAERQRIVDALKTRHPGLQDSQVRFREQGSTRPVEIEIEVSGAWKYVGREDSLDS